MGRKSTLTPAQIEEIIRRHLNGESIRDLAKEFGISYSALRERISAQTKKIKDVANQIVDAKRAVMTLPLSAQITAQSRAEKIILMQDLETDIAINGQKVAKRVGDIVVKRMEGQSDDGVMNDEALSQLAKAGTIINIHRSPANDFMEIERKNMLGKDDKEDMVITIEGGLPD